MDRRAQNTEFLTHVFEALGRIEANQASLRTELLGPGGRITELEKLPPTVEKHERIYVFGRWAGIPLLTVFHVGLKSILLSLGWK